MIKTSQKKDFELLTKILRKSSVYVAYFLNRMHIYPNMVTVSRFLLFGLGGAYCFYIGTHLLNAVGIILLFLNFYFDLVDGDLARNYNKKSELGKVLEELLDPILLNLIILSITLNLFSNDSTFKYFGLVCLFGQIFSLKASLYFKYNFNIDCVEGNDILEDNLKNKKIDFFSFFVKELITPKNIPMSLFSNFRYYLLVGTLSGVLPVLFSLYAIVINVRWIILSIFLLIMNSNLSIKERISMVSYLNKIQHELIKRG